MRTWINHLVPLTCSLVLSAGCSGDSDTAASADVSVPDATVTDATRSTGAELPEGVEPVALTVDTTAPLTTVDRRYLSLAIDASQVVGGYWWSEADGVTQGLGSERADPFDFTRPRLRAMAQALAPAYLRIGGTEADKLYYDFGDNPPDEPEAPFEFTLTAAQWASLNDFTAAVGYDLMFTLNAGPGTRDEHDAWTPDMARVLLEHAKSRGDQVAVWELGNEINGYPALHMGLRVDGPMYAADVAVARALIDEVDPQSLLAGPSSAFWPKRGELLPIMPEFMAAGGAALDLVTWHYYPQQSYRCPLASRRAGEDVLLVPEHLAEIDIWAEEVEGLTTEHAPEARVWLGETGNAQCGGEPGVSNTFVSGFWWLDQLGRMARRGQQVMVRQTLSGSEYGLLKDADLSPRPDFWTSVLFKRLMGPEVLQVQVPETPTLQVYAHCTPNAPGSVTFAWVNVDETRTFRLVGPEGLEADATLQMYVLSAPSLASPTVQLNGTELKWPDDNSVPALSPVTGSADLPPRTYGFAVWPEANAAACQE
ncbi:MAG: hypothetical protein ACE366_19445 [Bradymonadia bacterium]